MKVKINHPPRHLENLFDFQSRVCLECTLRRRLRGCSIQRAGVCNHKTFNCINVWPSAELIALPPCQPPQYTRRASQIIMLPTWHQTDLQISFANSKIVSNTISVLHWVLLFKFAPGTPLKINGWNLKITHLGKNIIFHPPPFLLCSSHSFSSGRPACLFKKTCKHWKFLRGIAKLSFEKSAQIKFLKSSRSQWEDGPCEAWKNGKLESWQLNTFQKPPVFWC